MKNFDLLNTPAENDIDKYFSDVLEDADAPYEILGYGVLVVKDDVPQLFIPIPESDVDNWRSVIRIDANNADEIRKTTRVYSGNVDDELIFFADKKLF